MAYTMDVATYDLGHHRNRVEYHTSRVEDLDAWLDEYDAHDGDIADAELDAAALEQEIYDAVRTVLPEDDDPARDSFYDLLQLRKRLRKSTDPDDLDDTPIPDLVAHEQTPYDTIDDYHETVEELAATYVSAEQQLKDEVLPRMNEIVGPIAIRVEPEQSTPTDTTDRHRTQEHGHAAVTESLSEAYRRRDGDDQGFEEMEFHPVIEGVDTIAQSVDRQTAKRAGIAAAGLAALSAGYLFGRKRRR